MIRLYNSRFISVIRSGTDTIEINQYHLLDEKTEECDLEHAITVPISGVQELQEQIAHKATMEWEDREPPVILYERQSDRLYTHKETCEKLAISPATLNRLMRDGQIEYAKIKNAVRFSESAIREFIARSTKGTDT